MKLFAFIISMLLTIGCLHLLKAWGLTLLQLIIVWLAFVAIYGFGLYENS